MWLFKITWEMPFDHPERLRERVRIDYPIKIDTILGGGVTPTQRLQRALRTPGEVSLVDIAVTVVYGSWFLPHALLAYLLLRDERYVPRAAGRLSAAYHLTTPFYWAVPTAPPWWASEHGDRMGGEVERIVRAVVCHVTGDRAAGEHRGPRKPVGVDAVRPHLLGGDHRDGPVGVRPRPGRRRLDLRRGGRLRRRLPRRALPRRRARRPRASPRSSAAASRTSRRSCARSRTRWSSPTRARRRCRAARRTRPRPPKLAAVRTSSAACAVAGDRACAVWGARAGSRTRPAARRSVLLLEAHARREPRPLAGEQQRGGEHDEPHERRVDDDGDRQADAELAQAGDVGEAEGDEDADHARARRR